LENFAGVAAVSLALLAPDELLQSFTSKICHPRMRLKAQLAKSLVLKGIYNFQPSCCCGVAAAFFLAPRIRSSTASTSHPGSRTFAQACAVVLERPS